MPKFIVAKTPIDTWEVFDRLGTEPIEGNVTRISGLTFDEANHTAAELNRHMSLERERRLRAAIDRALTMLSEQGAVHQVSMTDVKTALKWMIPDDIQMPPDAVLQAEASRNSIFLID